MYNNVDLFDVLYDRKTGMNVYIQTKFNEYVTIPLMDSNGNCRRIKWNKGKTIVRRHDKENGEFILLDSFDYDMIAGVKEGHYMMLSKWTSILSNG